MYISVSLGAHDIEVCRVVRALQFVDGLVEMLVWVASRGELVYIYDRCR